MEQTHVALHMELVEVVEHMVDAQIALDAPQNPEFLQMELITEHTTTLLADQTANLG